MKVMQLKNYDELSRSAADLIAAQVLMKPDCVLGLATGSTPVGTYKMLIENYKSGKLDFSAVTSVNLDEYVGLDESSDQSYRYFMNHQLFDHINIDKARTHVPDGKAADLQAECREYDMLTEKLGGIDFQLLGIGSNGHIGFNEPSDSFIAETHVVRLKEETIRANARFFASEEEVPCSAITMGLKSIMQAKKILLIANGDEKISIINKALSGPVTPQIPASILQLHPDCTFIFCR